jgi:hypothetical protein
VLHRPGDDDQNRRADEAKVFCHCDRHPAGIDIATEAFRRVFPRAWTGGRADAASVSAAVSQ